MEKTEQHPITPPLELVDKWYFESIDLKEKILYISTQAARWGADQELEACCEWIEDQLGMPPDSRKRVISKLVATRRPKPPSLKEQALALLQTDPENQLFLSEKGIAILRKALEALPND